jgi:hypothetical protein
MARRTSNLHRIDVGVTAAELAPLKRAAAARETNVTSFVRAAALRAAIRSDAVVRGHLNRMLGPDAATVRLLADCGKMIDRINELAAYVLDDQKLREATAQLSQRIAGAIKLIGGQS